MITARLYQTVQLRHSAQLLRFLKKTQFWPYEKIRTYQFRKLKKLLEHAYLHVPYYKTVFKQLGATPKDIRNAKDFRVFPILTKDIIRTNFEKLIANNMLKNDLIPNSTGGSTGEPLHYYQDTNYENWADAARIRGWYHLANCEIGDTCAVLWGAMREVKENFTLFERIKEYLTSGEVWLNAFNLSENRKIEFLRLCHIFRPKLLRGYFTAIKDFALFLDKERLPFPAIKGVILGAETVDQTSQTFIEKVFKAPSFNTYGGRELSLIAMECSHKNGLHEVSENNYVEFEDIDLFGHESAGNLIITNLNNYAMPFIRYRIGDIGIPGNEDSCECGRGLPLIKKIIGRTTEVFLFNDGTKIAGEMFIHLMKDFPLTEYQFVQTSDACVVLRYKRSEKVNNQIFNNIRQTYKKYLPEGVSLEFKDVDCFEKTPTGKFKFVLKDFS